MTNNLHPVMAQALAPFIKPVFSPAQAQEIDRAMLEDKRRDGYGQRQQDQAMRLQNQYGAL